MTTMADSPVGQTVLEMEARDSRNPPRNGAGCKRARKSRASTACLTCRVRKVRCDVVLLGSGPCSNCKYDANECRLAPKKKRRKAKMRFKEGVFSINTEIAPGVNCAAGIDVLEQFSAANLQEWRAHSVITRDSDERPIEMDDSVMELPIVSANDIGEQSQLPTASHLPMSAVASWDNLREESQQIFECDVPFSISTSASSPIYSVSTERSRTVRKPLLRLFKPFHARIEQDEYEHLQRMGALAVPPPLLQNALLKSYVEFVHGQLPMIDLKELSDVVQGGDRQDEQISLLLFQAVMLVGSTWVEIGKLKQAGFKSREDAQKILFKRVRLLYDSDCEMDQMSVIQSLLLMTFSKQQISESKDSWHWLGIAISLCYRFGLNRDTLSTSTPPPTKCLWRRIWWSCFIRDRTLAIREGRPVRIDVQDCDVPMLSMEDFPLNENNEPGEVARLSEMAERCIEKAILCWCSSSQQLGQHAASLKHQSALQTSPAGWDARLESTVPAVERSCRSSNNSTVASTISASDCSDCRRDCHDDMSTMSLSSAESSPMASGSSDYILIPADPTKDFSDMSDPFKVMGDEGEMGWDRTYWDTVENATTPWFGKIIV